MPQYAIVGEVALLPYNFAPRNWMRCTGQTLSIPSNSMLYSIIGTMYGGDGTSNFMLPDLRGCVPVGGGADTTFGESDDARERIAPAELDVPAESDTVVGQIPAQVRMDWFICVNGSYPRRPS